MFQGFDSRGRNLVFGFGIVQNYSEYEISWAVECFKSMMDQQQPYITMTEYNHEIASAVKKKFDDSW